MAHIGSVFLGDVQRQRILSTSTPPSSPPPHISPPDYHALPATILEDIPSTSKLDSVASIAPSKITPEVAIELRTRLLETLVVGVQPDARAAARSDSKNQPLIREVEEVQRKLDTAVQSSGSDALKWFVENYDQYKQYLTPAFALSGVIPTSSPLYENMTPSEVEAFLTEMDSDIRAADRDLRDIDMLDKKDVTAANKLPEYRKLQPRLDALLQDHEENRRKHNELEQRIARVMKQYASTTDILSELFVAWDDTLYDAEGRVARIERDQEERKRLGLA